MSVTVKHGARSVTIPLPSSLAELKEAVRVALELPEGTTRLLAKGKALEGDDVSHLAGAKLMCMHSSAASLDAAAAAKPDRVRGFEDGDRIQRTGGLGGRPSAAAASSGSSASKYRFHRTQALLSAPQFAMGAQPGPDAAAALLRKLATDPCILKLMEKRQWAVGLLAEMAPQGLVGVSASCLMGLNKNHGESIHLRLRTDNWQGLRKYESLVEVLLHELTHNRWSEHDDNFKNLNSELTKEYRANLEAYRGARSAADGPVAAAADEPSDEDAHQGYTLGAGGGAGGAPPALDPREAAARAAAARAAEQCADCVEDETMEEEASPHVRG